MICETVGACCGVEIGERQCPVGHDSQERKRDNAPHRPRHAICKQLLFLGIASENKLIWGFLLCSVKFNVFDNFGFMFLKITDFL